MSNIHFISAWIICVVCVASVATSLEAIEVTKMLAHQNASIKIFQGATDQWNWYQAKRIKKSILDVAILTGTPENEALKSESERNDNESKKISFEASRLEEESKLEQQLSHHHEERHFKISIALTFLHISMAIATLAIILKRLYFTIPSVILALIGMTFICVAYLN